MMMMMKNRPASSSIIENLEMALKKAYCPSHDTIKLINCIITSCKKELEAARKLKEIVSTKSNLRLIFKFKFKLI